MSEKKRTIILLFLLALGLVTLWLINREVDANFINQF